MGANYKKEFFNIINNKTLQTGVTIILFLILLISSTHIRVGNLPILKDVTTGKYTTNDLDSLYFYRIAQTKLDNNGELPEFDELRSPGYNTPWISEILPDVMILFYKTARIFMPDVTFNYIATISGPIIYAILLILFFILVWAITKSKLAALLSCLFLGFTPAFLFRSLAGFYDHDPLGVLAIITLLIILVFALKKIETSIKNSVIYGLLMGLGVYFVFISWGGAITFALVIVAVTSFIYYLLNCDKKENFIIFYFINMVSSVLFSQLIGGDTNSLITRYLEPYGLISFFVLGVAIIDYVLSKNMKRFSFLKKEKEKIYSVILTLILGLIGLTLVGKSPIELITKIWATLIYPFFREFGGRLGATVAENAQPHLVDLISQTSLILVWLFILGLFLISIGFVKQLKSLKNKIYLSSSIFILFICILFSRYSESSLFNGENFISQMVYIAGVLVFMVGFFYVYSKEKFRVDTNTIILFALAFTVVINARAAVRSFFLITPFICLIAGMGIVEIFKSARKSKDETLKYILIIFLVFITIAVYLLMLGNPFKDTIGIYGISSQQAKSVGPSSNIQWQNAMAWVRNNTPEKAIFVHWWDYGYFIQTLAGRPTVTDGGHSGGDDADHFIGRYVLTTPNPKTAYSFMKTWNVSYLLVDPTEMGKYGAFSKIGSDNSWDRVSSGIFSGVIDDKQTQETANGIKKIYQAGGCVDGDIAYENENTSVFLPGISITKQQRMICKSYLAGVILEIEVDNGTAKFKQPIGIFFYNDKQYRVPIKNIYFQNKMITFEEGIDSVIYLIPKIDESSGKMDSTGALIYLSPRTFNSLIGRLYILNDPYKEYLGLTIAHKEEDPAVAYFKQFTGGELNEFIYYQGLRAPLKIWKVTYPSNTSIHEEFLARQFTFGGLDYLF